MKTIKKSIAVLMALVMVLAIAPISAFAEDDALKYLKYEIKNDEVIITGYKNAPVDLVIPAEIEGLPVTEISGDFVDGGAFTGCKSLEYITIPDSVKSIGWYAFRECVFLQSVTIPDSVTEISVQTFASCYRLKSVYIPDTVTSIGAYAFANCYSLQNIYIPETVAYIGDGAFYNCSALEDITIPDGVKIISESIFEGCSALELVIIPSSITDIENNAFYGCDKLRGIIYVGKAYQAENLIIFGKNTIPADVKIVCRPNFYDDAMNFLVFRFYEDHVEIVGYNYNPVNLNIPAKIEGLPVTVIEMEAFSNCRSLESVTIPESVTYVDSFAFNRCNSLAAIDVSENNEEYASIDGVLFSKDKTKIVCYPAGKSATSYQVPSFVKTIGNDAFSNCSLLQSITIPDSVTSIGMSAFCDCSSLENITISNSVTNIDLGTFEGCSALQSIIIPDSVISISMSAFSYCSSLESITISDSVKNIDSSAFLNTAYYNDESNWENGVLYIGNHLIEAKKDISGYYIIKNGTKTIANGAFYNCSSLESITIPDSVTSIGNNAFSNTAYYNDDSNWENGVLYIGNHLITAKKDISGDYTIKNGTKTIANGAFYNCSSLQNVVIPVSVTSIGSIAFYGCSSLTTVDYMGTNEQWSKISIDEENDKLTTVTINYNYKLPCEHGNTTVLDAIDATCTKSGMTNGMVCADCGEMIIDQTEIPPKGHNGEWITEKAATDDTAGLEIKKCTVCGEKLEERVIPKLKSDYMLGDINGDGKVTATDARIVLRISTKLEKLEDQKVPMFEAADVNKDGKITATDARKILRVSTKLESFENNATVSEPNTEVPTTEAPTTETPTTEVPTTEAPTTEAPTTEAPTTEAPTTEASTTAEPVTIPSNIPEEIVAFCNGNYYLEGNYGGLEIKSVVKGKTIEVVFASDGTEMGLYTNSTKNEYLINYKNKTFVSLEKVQAFFSEFGEDFDVMNYLDLSIMFLGEINIDSAIAKKTTIDSKEACVWEITSNNAKLYFTVVDGNVTKIENSNHETIVAFVEVTKLTSEIPANFYVSNSNQFKETEAFPFIMALTS